jgi:hypothetical protein
MTLTTAKPDISQKHTRYSKPVLWTVMFFMAASVLVLYDIPLAHSSSAHAHYMSIRWMLIPHMTAGILALLSGPLQFSTRIRRRSIQLHRILGRVYVFSVFTAVPLAIAIVFYLHLPRIVIIANLVQAFTWFVTTLAAFLTARNRYISLHRQWMVRSYSVTFTFVLIRVLAPFKFWIHQGTSLFSATSIIITFLAIFVSDIALTWHEITNDRKVSPRMQSS